MNGSVETCAACLSDKARPYWSGFRRCADCGHVWYESTPDSSALSVIYGRDYFHGAEYTDYEQEGPALRRNARARLRRLCRAHPARAELWEIGCAYGFFLSEASGHFTASGCDISEHACAYARQTLGQNAVCGDYSEIVLERPKEVICLWDTVEHLAHPHRYLAKAYADLAPGGTLALSTGNRGAAVARIRGKRWRMVHPPTHLHYFTGHSISVLLARLGFESVEIRHHAVWRHADGVGCRLFGQRPGSPAEAVYRFFHSHGLLNFYFPMNLFDIMTVYAKKPA